MYDLHFIKTSLTVSSDDVEIGKILSKRKVSFSHITSSCTTNEKIDVYFQEVLVGSFDSLTFEEIEKIVNLYTLPDLPATGRLYEGDIFQGFDFDQLVK